MATIKGTLTEIEHSGEGKAWVCTWTPMLNGDVGDPVTLPGYHDRSVQVTGTFGTGGSVAVEGSNDGAVNYAALRDPSSTTIAITSAGMKAVLEAAIHMRPHVTAGDGTTSLTVSMYFVKPAR